MPTPTRFSHEQLLEAALALVDDAGPAGLTVAAVARKVGAPSGSVYHRFPSREVLVGELWLAVVEDFQASFIPELAAAGPPTVARAVVDWIVAHPDRARLLLLHRREDLMASSWPESLRDRAEAASSALDAGLATVAAASGVSVETLLFVVAELPLAVCRPFLQGRGEVGPARRHVLDVALAAVLADAGYVPGT